MIDAATARIFQGTLDRAEQIAPARHLTFTFAVRKGVPERG